jgi:hypothetical protein
MHYRSTHPIAVEPSSTVLRAKAVPLENVVQSTTTAVPLMDIADPAAKQATESAPLRHHLSRLQPLKSPPTALVRAQKDSPVREVLLATAVVSMDTAESPRRTAVKSVTQSLAPARTCLSHPPRRHSARHPLNQRHLRGQLLPKKCLQKAGAVMRTVLLAV